MPNIKEIAKIAGVSPATVSRVINKTAKVDADKEKRVKDAIKKTGYKPNALARALYKQSSKIIGLILPDITNPFFNELARVVEERAHKKGYNILLCNSSNDEEKEASSINLLTSMKADGIILITNSTKTGRMIHDCGLPVIVVDRHVKNGGEVAHIESDHYKGGRLAAKCLIDLGCKDIVCLRGPQSFTSGVLRFKGYQDVCKEEGRPLKYIDTEYNFQSGTKAAEKMLKKYPNVDGVIAANDMVAISTYKVLAGKGIKVPKDVQLIGFDDIGFSNLITPALTTIHQPIGEMGEKAIDIICKYIDGKPFDVSNVFDVSLVKRETTR